MPQSKHDLWQSKLTPRLSKHDMPLSKRDQRQSKPTSRQSKHDICQMKPHLLHIKDDMPRCWSAWSWRFESASQTQSVERKEVQRSTKCEVRSTKRAARTNNLAALFVYFIMDKNLGICYNVSVEASKE